MSLVEANAEFIVDPYPRHALYRLRYLLRVNCGGLLHFSMQKTPLVSYILNKCAEKIIISEDGLGYTAAIPERAQTALQYLYYYTGNLSTKDIDGILESGETGLRRLKRSLGCNVDGKSVRNLFFEDLKGKHLSLSFSNYPTLTLKNDEDIYIRFKDGDADPQFLKRLLDGASEEDLKILRGITLLRSQRKHMRRFSEGKLSLEDVARALKMRGLMCGSREDFQLVVKWLGENGFSEEAKDLIVKKALIRQAPKHLHPFK